MVARYRVSSATKLILLTAIVAVAIALSGTALLFDEATEFRVGVDFWFARLIGMVLGPVFILIGGGALIFGDGLRGRRPPYLAGAAIGFGLAMTWLFFIETTEFCVRC